MWKELSSPRLRCALQRSTEEKTSREKNMASMANSENSKQDNDTGIHGSRFSLLISTYNGGGASM